MHAASGTVALLAITYLGGFLLVKGESPRGYALPILIVILIAATAAWWITRPRKSEGEAGSDESDHPAASPGNSTEGPASPIYHLENSPITVHPPVSGPSGSPLARGLADGLAELEAIRRGLLRAEASKELNRKPPSRRQSEVAALLTDQGWHDSRQILDDAYGATEDLWERLNVPSRRWDGGPITPTIDESDDLAGVIVKVDDAIAELRRRQGGSPAQPEEARVEFAAVEVAKERWVREANVFLNDWKGAPIVFSLINPRGGPRARAVRPVVTVRDPDGAVLAGPANARWANPIPPAKEEVERDIPANGAPVAIDTVIQPVAGDKFWLVTDENLRIGLKGSEAIESVDFQVTVSIQGENVAETSHTVRVRLGFPLPAVGDDEPTDTRLPPSPDGSDPAQTEEPTEVAEVSEDAAAGVAPTDSPVTAESDDDPAEPESVKVSRRPARRSGPRSHATLDKLWVEGKRMLNASGPFAALGAGVLYGPRPTEADIDRWQGKVRAALPRTQRRRFRFAPLEAEVNRSPLADIAIPSVETKGARRVRESLDELERIMDELDEP